MQETLINYFHCTADNVGDRMSGPAQYFWPKLFTNHPLSGPIARGVSTAIIGGGQIFRQLESMALIATSENLDTKIAVWGVGLPKFGKRTLQLSDLKRTTFAFSTRNYDWRDHIQFVPCASCMSPKLDSIPPIKHEFVVYCHRKKAAPLGIPEGVPVMDNSWGNAGSAIDFIASGETVVTSSYHGVYWAQLMGRRVICVPYSEKFETFQHSPTFCTSDNWISDLRNASKVESLLEEYRELNINFAKCVEDRNWIKQ